MIIESLNTHLSNKNQKIVVCTVQCIVDLLNNYGPKKLNNFKNFLAEMEKQGQTTVAVIKKEIMIFYKEAMKWMGDKFIE